MSKRKSIFSIIFSLIFSLFLVNCDVFSFNGDLQSQIIKDTTFTVIFHEFDPDDLFHPESKTLVKHYELSDSISASEFPDRESKELKDWNPLFLIRGWKIANGSPDVMHYVDQDAEYHITSIMVSSILENLDEGTYSVDLYPDWYRARIITFRDGNYDCNIPDGKDYSGFGETYLRTESGVKVDIPRPSEAVHGIGSNSVIFDGWYLDSACTHECTKNGSDYYFDDSSQTDDFNLYAKWKYKYVYVDPDNTSGIADDKQTGIDSSHPVKTIAEAKKYLYNNDTAFSIKLMSTIENEEDINALSNLTTSDYHSSTLLRSPGFTGKMIDVSTVSGASTEYSIQNLTIDGGAFWNSAVVSSRNNSGIKAQAPVIQNTAGKLTLTNVTIQNNDNVLNSYTDQRVSGIYSPTTLSCINCTFKDNSSYIASGANYKYCSVVCADSQITFTNSTIENNKGHGLYVGTNISMCVLTDTSVTGNSEYGAYVSAGRTLTVDGSTSFGTPVYLEANTASNSANIKIQNATGLTATLVAQIKSDVYADSPKVLTDTSNGSAVSLNIDKFTCTQEGYVIVYDSTNKAGYIKMQSFGFGIEVEIPDGYTEISPGSFPSLNVYRSDGVIRFNVSDDAYAAITTWSGKKPLQYMINEQYGCVEISHDASGYYANIRITGEILKDFNGTKENYTCPLGINSLQVYSQTTEGSMTVITKLNVQILVQ